MQWRYSERYSKRHSERYSEIWDPLQLEVKALAFIEDNGVREHPLGMFNLLLVSEKFDEKPEENICFEKFGVPFYGKLTNYEDGPRTLGKNTCVSE